MKRNLYGLTFYILIHVVSKTIPILKKTSQKVQALEKNWDKTSFINKDEEKMSSKRVKEWILTAIKWAETMTNVQFGPKKVIFND